MDGKIEVSLSIATGDVVAIIAGSVLGLGLWVWNRHSEDVEKHRHVEATATSDDAYKIKMAVLGAEKAALDAEIAAKKRTELANKKAIKPTKKSPTLTETLADIAKTVLASRSVEKPEPEPESEKASFGSHLGFGRHLSNERPGSGRGTPDAPTTRTRFGASDSSSAPAAPARPETEVKGFGGRGNGSPFRRMADREENQDE